MFPPEIKLIKSDKVWNFNINNLKERIEEFNKSMLKLEKKLVKLNSMNKNLNYEYYYPDDLLKLKQLMNIFDKQLDK